MVWTIELSSLAQKNLSQSDPQIRKRILLFLNERIVPIDNPRLIGEALQGNRLGEFWKYRVGDYRLICHIEDEMLRILVVRVGNRRGVYR
ncbi:MAG: type II toxin-antitoxin system RelE/ParE family toxin [Sulfuriferula sp.]